MSQLTLLAVALTLCLSLAATAGDIQPYTPLVWDEDWSYLAQPGGQRDWSDHLHYVVLGDDAHYLALGGQSRMRGEYFDHPAWGAQPSDNGYFLQRYLFSADWHQGDALRVFVQPGSSIIDGRDGGPRPSIDRSDFNLNQAFVDLHLLRSKKLDFKIRAGRQFVSLGSGRLFAIGAGLNVEQPFDGVRLSLNTTGWSLEGLALRPVLVQAAAFGSKPNPAVSTWVVYATHHLPWLAKAALDLYYAGFDHKTARWNQGTAREQRESFGARWFARTATWYYDFEYTAQLGRFGSGDIRAWASGYNGGYRFQRLHWHPTVELDGGFTSGDSNLHDHTLGTFNPLFPNGSYLSQSLLIGPYNLNIVRPKLALYVTQKLTINPNYEWLWRHSRADGTYNIAGILTHPGTLSRARYVGSQAQVEIDYAFDRHWSGMLVYEHFFNGAFLKQAPPNRTVNFIAPQLTWTF